MFEVRKPPFLPARSIAPSPPDDVTPDLVRGLVSADRNTRVVELSAAFLKRRPGSDVEQWRRLDQEFEGKGIPVYFVPGGCCTWEVRLCIGTPDVAATGSTSAHSPSPASESRKETVTPAASESKSVTGVLQQSIAPENAAESVSVADRVRQLADQGISTSQISRLLEAEGYGRTSHMKVARELRRQAQYSQLPLL